MQRLDGGPHVPTHILQTQEFLIQSDLLLGFASPTLCTWEENRATLLGDIVTLPHLIWAFQPPWKNEAFPSHVAFFCLNVHLDERELVVEELCLYPGWRALDGELLGCEPRGLHKTGQGL